MALISGGLKRVDLNQHEVVETLRDLGAVVTDLSAVGQGCPDLLVSWREDWYLLEVKGAKGKLTAKQTLWHDKQKAQVHVIRSRDDVFSVLGVECEPGQA